MLSKMAMQQGQSAPSGWRTAEFASRLRVAGQYHVRSDRSGSDRWSHDQGVIFHYAGPQEMKRLCERYAPLPMVTQEAPIPGIPRTYINFYQGMYDILVHLIEVHQYRRIAFVRGPEESMICRGTLPGVLRCLWHIPEFPLMTALSLRGTFFEPSGQKRCVNSGQSAASSGN